MLIYLRHGKTALNAEGSEERLRGWTSVPLAPEGIQQAQEASGMLTKAPDTFSTSDLPRALQTSQIVGQKIGKAAVPDPRIRDWNTGSLAGQKVLDVLPTLQKLITSPDQPAPDGEAFNDYLNRFVPVMKDMVASPGVHLVVGHARGASVLEGIASPVGGKGQDIDPNYVMGKPNVQPGGMIIIGPDWNPVIKNVTTTMPQPPGPSQPTQDPYQAIAQRGR